MTTPAALRFGVDRLIATDKRIFGWGWAGHGSHDVIAVHLRIEGDGWERRLQADRGLARPDVARAFPLVKNAAASGFIVTGYVPDAGARRYSLEVDLDDGQRIDVDVSSALARPEAVRRGRQLRYLLRAVWRRLKRGDVGGILRRARAQSYAAASLDADVLDELLASLRGHPSVWLVIDHNMGGGANAYRRALIEERVKAGDAVVFCTYNLPMLEYRAHVHIGGAAERIFRISSLLVLEPLFAQLPSLHVFLNSPVSFDEPLMLAEWLARMRGRYAHTRLVASVHDYFAACPSFVLLDADGRHCGVPALEECAKCLPRHEASYVSLSPPSEIGAWRASWARCLFAADEVRCFSEASRRLLLRAHPSLAAAKVTVVPHKVEFAPQRMPRIDAAGPLVIGVVGEISTQKGALIVKRMVEIIERERRQARVVVIGSLDAVCDSPRLTVTGPYRREELPALIEKHGVNMFLFSSVWPETFSYVVAELMALRAPLVCFDLGAPAERVASYPLGRISPDVCAESALATLTAFHAELAKAPVARVA